MRITDAFVDNPVNYSHTDLPPRLVVVVDEFHRTDSAFLHISTEMTSRKHGIFVEWTPEEFHSGYYNVAGTHGGLPVVVDCSIIEEPGKPGDFTGDVLEGRFGIPLTRARQLLRKYADAWKYQLVDREGQAGRITWWPYNVYPECSWVEGHGKYCGIKATYIWIDQVDVPLCPKHVRAHNEAAKARREGVSR